MLNGPTKKNVKIRKAISSGNVSLIFPLYPNVSLAYSKGTHSICNEQTTIVKMSCSLTITLWKQAPSISIV